MNRRDRQRLNILLVLLVVLGLTVLLVYRMNRPISTSAVQTREVRKTANPPAASDARIRLDLVDKREADQAIGRNNVFQYRERRPAPSSSRPSPVTVIPAAPPVNPAVRPSVPPPPPPPPPIPLKYQGFAVVNSEPGMFTAFLSDDGQRHYNVTVGEVLLGRYRIVRISDSAVEVEDMQYNRRQTLPLLK